MDQVINIRITSIDSFRRYLTDFGFVDNPEYGIDIKKGLPKISDYGNI